MHSSLHPLRASARVPSKHRPHTVCHSPRLSVWTHVSSDPTQVHPHDVHSDCKLSCALIRLCFRVLRICAYTGDRDKTSRNQRCAREASQERCFLLMTSSESDSDDGSDEGECRGSSNEPASATPTRKAAPTHGTPAPPSKHRAAGSHPTEVGGAPSRATAALPPAALTFPSVVHHTSPHSGTTGSAKRAIRHPPLVPVTCTASPVPNGFNRRGEQRWKPLTKPCVVCLRDADRIRKVGPVSSREYAEKKKIYNKQMHEINTDVVCPLCAPANIFVHTGECFDTHVRNYPRYTALDQQHPLIGASTTIN